VRTLAVALAGALAALLLSASAARAAESAADATVVVRAKAKPDQPWKEYPTRTLEGLAGYRPGAPAPALSKYGGRADVARKATGFFRVEKTGDRWWLVDPEGRPFIHVAVVSVRYKLTDGAKEAFAARFGSPAKWAADTAALLRGMGFNGTGAWTDDAALAAAPQRLVYTPIHNFMSGFGKSIAVTHQQPGHVGYVKDCIPVFHPDFPAYCAKAARALEATKDDPWLLGHFSDNEMPCPRDLLDKTLSLDPADPVMGANRRAADAWLAARRGAGAAGAKVTNEERDAWRGHVFDAYYRITTEAIRRADPNHLCLGSRLYGSEKTCPDVWQAAGRHLDAVAVNYYGAWTPSADVMAKWAAWSGRPFIVTEWYTKGEDSGMKNATGAGWIVPTQADRGLFYQNYTLALLESKACVGWHWFKYQDNDPADLTTDPSNRDSNKGVVSIRFEPYADMAQRMNALNREVYGLADFFDRQGR
jgi:hypothetical protein